MKITITIPPPFDALIRRYCKEVRTTPKKLFTAYALKSILYRQHDYSHEPVGRTVIKPGTISIAGGPELSEANFSELIQ